MAPCAALPQRRSYVVIPEGRACGADVGDSRRGHMRRAVLLTALVLVIGGLVYLTITSEVAELAASGGIRELREPLRPIRGETRVLLVGLDGVAGPILYEAVRNGSMPNVAALLGTPADTVSLWEHGYGARDVMSVLPSETTAGWTAVLTGARPADSGVPGNEWFVRDSLAFYAPVPLSVDSYAHTIRIYTDGLIGHRIQVPTLFERLGDIRSHVALGFVSRGADVFTPPDFSRLPHLVKQLFDVALGRNEVGEELYETLDYHAVTGMRKAAEQHGLPDLQFVYFPGIDLLSHESETSLERQHTYLADVIDPAMNEVLAVYRERGALDETYVLFVADHGHTPHVRDDAHALDEEPRALLDSLGLRVRDPGIGRDSTGRYDAVFAANEAFAFLYLADRSTCPAEDDACDWSRPPRHADDVLPVARALHAANETGALVPSLKGTLDLILVREPRPAPMHGEVTPNSASARRAAPYHVFETDSLTSLDDYLTRHPRPDLARFRERMSWLTDGPHGHLAGDIALIARDGTHLPLAERFYFGPPSNSGHGSAHLQDSVIPLLLVQPRSSGAHLRDLLHEITGPTPTQLSITPLVEALLERNALATTPQ